MKGAAAEENQDWLEGGSPIPSKKYLPYSDEMQYHFPHFSPPPPGCQACRVTFIRIL